MNQLSLHDPAPMPRTFAGGLSIDNLSWWFWIKGGIGFTVGAGAAYILGQIVWLLLVYKTPTLLLWKWILRI